MKRYIFIAILLAAAIIAVPARAAEPLSITVDQAVLMALENSPAFAIERMNPDIRRAGEQRLMADFDPTISNTVSASNSKSSSDTKSRSASDELSLSQKLRAGAEVTISLNGSTSGGDTETSDSARLGLSLSQPLARGAGADVNLASLRSARLDTQISLYELEGTAETLIAQVEQACWDYEYARENLALIQESLDVAQKQLEATEVMVQVGKTAAVELASARAETASRKQQLISARGTLDTARIKLLRLILPQDDNAWDADIEILQTAIPAYDEPGNAETHIERAMTNRPDLNQARLSLEKNELQLVQSENGLLPYMNVFVTLGGTGYAGTLGGALGDVATDGYDLRYGLTYQKDIGNRSSRAVYRQNQLQHEQAELSIVNLERLAQEDVRSAVSQINTSREEMAAAEATRVLMRETLRLEAEKFNIGKSNSLLLAVAQRNMLSAQISELKAAVTYRKAVVDLYRLDGTLLEQRGISLEQGPALP